MSFRKIKDFVSKNKKIKESVSAPTTAAAESRVPTASPAANAIAKIHQQQQSR